MGGECWVLGRWQREQLWDRVGTRFKLDGTEATGLLKLRAARTKDPAAAAVGH